MSKIHVLLLDDNTLFRVMLTRFLETDPSFQVVADVRRSPTLC
jgi:DNA-binding NarL/FixJ family response regulator